ncbi:proteasome subunit beta, partial [Streptomyces sp. NPDC059695]
MEANPRSTGRLPAAFLTPGSSSFMDFLADHSPDLLPGNRKLPEGIVEAPHGTTIVAATFPGGVVGGGGRGAAQGLKYRPPVNDKLLPAAQLYSVCEAPHPP